MQPDCVEYSTNRLNPPTARVRLTEVGYIFPRWEDHFTMPANQTTTARIACARSKCKRTFAPVGRGQANRRYCSDSCRVLDWQQKNGRVVAWITTDPATGKATLTVPLPLGLFRV